VTKEVDNCFIMKVFVNLRFMNIGAEAGAAARCGYGSGYAQQNVSAPRDAGYATMVLIAFCFKRQTMKFVG
jgi:hypothetical protein